ncbi:hypothetical protein Tco_0757578 [Tanacetum coccineum]
MCLSDENHAVACLGPYNALFNLQIKGENDANYCGFENRAECAGMTSRPKFAKAMGQLEEPCNVITCHFCGEWLFHFALAATHVCPLAVCVLGLDRRDEKGMVKRCGCDVSWDVHESLHGAGVSVRLIVDGFGE